MSAATKDSSGRVVRFVTKRGRGVTVYRPHKVVDGERVYRNRFVYMVKRNNKHHNFTLAKEKDAAEKLANEIQAFLADPSKTIHEAFEKFNPDKVKPKTSTKTIPTVGEVIEDFTEVSGKLAESSTKEYINSLRRIAAYILKLKTFTRGIKKDERLQWIKKTNSLSVDRITLMKIEAFRSSLIKRAGKDEIEKGRAIVTANAHVRNAGAIFAPKWRKLYGSFTLPEPCPFKEAGRLEERPHRYVSNVDLTALIQAAKLELEGNQERQIDYLVFVLSLFGGLRRKEIDRLIWDQVDFEGKHIWIRTTPYFKPKARNSENRVDCPDEVFEVLRKFKPLSITPPFVLAGGSPDSLMRCMPVYRRLNKWLKKQMGS